VPHTCVAPTSPRLYVARPYVATAVCGQAVCGQAVCGHGQGNTYCFDLIVQTEATFITRSKNHNTLKPGQNNLFSIIPHDALGNHPIITPSCPDLTRLSLTLFPYHMSFWDKWKLICVSLFLGDKPPCS